MPTGRGRAGLTYELEYRTYLDVVVAVVVQVEHSVDLAVPEDSEVVLLFDSLAHGLPRVLLHLDVVELPVTQQNRPGYQPTEESNQTESQRVTRHGGW